MIVESFFKIIGHYQRLISKEGKRVNGICFLEVIVIEKHFIKGIVDLIFVIILQVKEANEEKIVRC